MAAEQGVALAQFSLGRGYYDGRGVPQDYAEAVKWYRLAAEQGDADAQFTVGRMYSKGQGVPQDYGEAVKWFRLAAEQGKSRAQASLGMVACTAAPRLWSIGSSRVPSPLTFRWKDHRSWN